MEQQDNRVHFRKTLYFKMVIVTVVLGLTFFLALGFIYQFSTERFRREMTAQSDALTEQICQNVETVLKEQGILNMEACIGYPEKEDEYLDKNSAQFHAHMGYRMVGEFKKCGYKFDRWYNMVWMEHMIGEHQAHMTAPVSFPQIRNRLKEKYGLE